MSSPTLPPLVTAAERYPPTLQPRLSILDTATSVTVWQPTTGMPL